MKEISRKYWKINNLSPKPTQKYYKTQEFGSGTFSCFPKWCNKAYISLSVRGGAFTLGESFSQRKIKNKNSTNWKKFQENENTTNPKKPQNWRIWKWYLELFSKVACISLSEIFFWISIIRLFIDRFGRNFDHWCKIEFRNDPKLKEKSLNATV